MRKPQVKQKRVNGIVAYSEDRNIWRWEAGDLKWQWCKLGHLYLVGAHTSARVFWAKTLPEAVSFSLGVTEGLNYRRGGNVLDRAIVGLLPAGDANGQATHTG